MAWHEIRMAGEEEQWLPAWVQSSNERRERDLLELATLIGPLTQPQPWLPVFLASIIGRRQGGEWGARGRCNEKNRRLGTYLGGS